MSTVQPLYGSSGQSYSVTLNSLGSAAYKSGAPLHNTSLFDDYRFQFKWKNGASVSGVPTVSVYLAESADGGTTYSDGLAASSTVTPTATPNLKLLYQLNCPTASTQYTSDVFWVKSAAGIWTLPDYCFLVFLNGTGGTSDSTAGNFSVWYEGVNPQIV